MKKLIAYAVVLTALIVAIYGCGFTYSIEPFFSVLLSHPEAFIDKVYGMEYHAIRCVHNRASIALDTKGRVYILGLKKGRPRILVLNRKGKMERIIILRLKDNRLYLDMSPLISVSPSGNFIWTVRWEGIGVHRFIVHDRNGKAKMDWLIKTEVTSHLALNAYSEEGAYLVSGTDEFIRFRLGQKEPQRIKLSENFHPPYPVFFHGGKYWGIIGLNWLISEINHQFQGQIGKAKIRNKEDLFGVVTWLPQEGMRLLSVIKLPGLSASKSTVVLQWIDDLGNLYIGGLGYNSLYDSLPSWARKRIWREWIIKILKVLRLYDSFLRPVQDVTLRIFSPRGELKEVIRLRQVIRPRRGEKLEYGQLVKIDERGIYWEVEKVNEPREYRIVRIVKKKRWQVWWEAFRSWFNPVQSKGKTTY